MQTVSFVCEKGGVGKTALADEFYYFLEREGVATSLYALDSQYVSRSKLVSGPDCVILDTAGSLDGKLRDIVGRSDLVIIPVRPSLNDIEPFSRTLSLVESLTDAPVFIVVNAATPFTMCKNFLEWLRRKDFGHRIFTVPQSEAFAQSIGSGKSVFVMDTYGKVSGALEELFVAMCSELDL